MGQRLASAAAIACACCALAWDAAAVHLAEAVFESSESASAAVKSVDVACPAGTRLFGGGARLSSVVDAALVESRSLVDVSSGDPVGWSAEQRDLLAEPGPWWVTGVALCGHARGLERVEATSALDSSTKFLDVSCPPGKSALGGGFDLAGFSAGVAVRTSAPILDDTSGAPIGWTVSAYEEIPSAQLWSVHSEVLCTDEPLLAFEVTDPRSNDAFSGLDLHCPPGWIATGGGVQAVGLLADWVTSSSPEPDGDDWRWRQWQARDASSTGNAEHRYFAICPEPGQATPAVALGLLLVRASRRRARPTRDPGPECRTALAETPS